MKRSISIFYVCCAIAFIAIGVSGQPSAAGKDKAGSNTAISSFSSISKEEIEMLMADLAKTNPAILKRLSEDPEMKRQQIDNLKQLLAFASQAQKDGLADDPVNLQELENVRSEVVAVNYDKEINKNKGPMPPFGFITGVRVKRFWDEGGRDREAEFQKFLDSKIAILKQSNPQMKDRDTSDEEKTQAREFFAKVEIYEKEFDDKAVSGLFSTQVKKKVDLQVRLQQAQFMARLYSEKLAHDLKVTDEDVSKYLAEHPEFDTTAKKAKAENILNLAKAGEDFARLVNEFTEDPGNKGPNGKPQGGIYTDVPIGRMVPPFEQAALALEPGQITPNLVETDFGYHIIKLEKKGVGKDAAGQPTQIYDVRHILISTMYNDPAAPDEGGKPVKSYVRSKLEAEKEKRVLDKIVAENNIQVPEDFTVPEVAVAEKPKVAKKALPRKKRVVKKRR
jgi:PPIC-type PPIASE domain